MIVQSHARQDAAGRADDGVAGVAEVIEQDEDEAHGETEADAHQQIGEEDGHHRDDEGDELRMPLGPRVADQGGVGQLVAGVDEDRGE